MMMGERRGMQEALFYGFSLERHVPDDHLLQKIDRFVDLSERSARAGETFSDVILRLTDRTRSLRGPRKVTPRLTSRGARPRLVFSLLWAGPFLLGSRRCYCVAEAKKPCASTLMSVDRALSKRDFMVRGLGRKKQA